MSYMNRGGLDEPDIAVEAGAGIPAGGAGRVIEPEDELVFLAGPCVRRQIDAPGGVAISPATDDLTVQPDGRVRHGSVYIQENGFACVLRRNWEFLAIPANART